MSYILSNIIVLKHCTQKYNRNTDETKNKYSGKYS